MLGVHPKKLQRMLQVYGSNFRNLVQEVLTTSGRLNSGEQTTYGFGLFIRPFEGRRTIQHGGEIHGFTCALSYYPDEDVTLVLLNNLRTGEARRLAQEIQRAIFTE